MKNNKEYQKIKKSLFRHQNPGLEGLFESALWDLIFLSDETNKARIELGFPVHIQVYKDWAYSKGNQEFFKEFLNEVKNEL